MGGIFDEYGKFEKEKKEKLLKKAAKEKKPLGPKPMPKHPLANQGHPNELKDKIAKEKYEMAQLFRKMDLMKGELDDKLSEIYNLGNKFGINPNLAFGLSRMTIQDELNKLGSIEEKIRKKDSAEKYDNEQLKIKESEAAAKSKFIPLKKISDKPEITPEEAAKAMKEEKEKAMTKLLRAKMRGSRQKWLRME